MKHINTLMQTSIEQPQTELLVKHARTSIFALIFVALACFFSPAARAVLPAPGGGYPGRNTAEGDDALFSLTTGIDNTAMGFAALQSNTSAEGNTAIGYDALYSNTTGRLQHGHRLEGAVGQHRRDRQHSRWCWCTL